MTTERPAALAPQPQLEPLDERELATVLRLLRRLDARLVNVGHGRDAASIAAARRFIAAWEAAGGDVGAVVSWPSSGASWLRPAQRLASGQPDAWVIADTHRSWARMVARLSGDTGWDPTRTVGFAGVGLEQLLTDTAPGAVEGLSGACSDGAVWHVHRNRLIEHRPTNPRRADAMALIPRQPMEIAPGAVHVPDWLSLDAQRHLVEECRGWAKGPAPMRHTRLPNGGVMSVQTVCLGWHWAPYRYTRTADDVDGAPVAPFPDWLVELGQKALADAWGIPSAPGYRPDAALINFYDEHATLGMHQDKDERSDAPVVSLSIGDTCTFRFGNTQRRGRPYTDVELCTGDLFVFGGPSRFAYHGITAVQPGTADPRAGLSSGRVNLTLRVTGLED